MLRRLAALGPRRRALLAAGAAWVVAARAALAAPGGSLPRAQGFVDRLAPRLPPPPACTVEEAAWAITATARRLPGTRCLAWALALRGLLGQAGIACALRIGVRARGASTPRAYTAHAFIEHDGRRLSWGDAGGYRVLRRRAAAS